MINSNNTAITNDLKKPDNLIWLDMEMTGLNHEEHVILEVAVVITDANLNILAETISYAINQPNQELAKMDNWNVKIHTKSGLLERVKQSSYTVKTVEEELLAFISNYVHKGKSPLCGNTIYQDRKFITKYMPKFDEYIHYRNLDVTTLKELAKRWYPSIYSGFTKHNKHEALADIHESIAELKYYREKIFIAS